MKLSTNSKLGSILFSTACLVAFGLLAGPVIQPASRVSGGLEIHRAASAEGLRGEVRVVAGKSIIMESAARITRVSVDNPEVARTTAIDEHELLVNAKLPGRTRVTVWQGDGANKQFDLCIDNEVVPANVQVSALRKQENGHGLTSAYQDAMARVQTAITGVAR
jgi:Flp pilus assembly secretin CpaC